MIGRHRVGSAACTLYSTGEALYTGERGYLAVSVDLADPTRIEEVSPCTCVCACD